MKKIFVIIFCSIILIQCKKKYVNPYDDNLYGDKTLSGRVYFSNQITGTGILQVAKEVHLYLSFSGTPSTLDYDVTTVADTNGYFSFKNVPSGSTIFAQMQI